MRCSSVYLSGMFFFHPWIVSDAHLCKRASVYSWLGLQAGSTHTHLCTHMNTLINLASGSCWGPLDDTELLCFPVQVLNSISESTWMCTSVKRWQYLIITLCQLSWKRLSFKENAPLFLHLWRGNRSLIKGNDIENERKISRRSEPARSRQGVFHPWLDGAVHLWLFYCPSTPVQAHHQVQRSLHCLLNSELLSAGDPVSSWMNLKPSTSLTTSSPNPSSILPFFHPSGGPSWTPFSLPGVRPVPGCLNWTRPTPWIYLIRQKEEDFRSFFVFLFGGGHVSLCVQHTRNHIFVWGMWLIYIFCQT